MLKLALKTLILILFTLSLAAPTAAETFAWQGEAAATNLLHIDIRKGDILVRRSTSNRIEVSAVKRGRDLEVRQVKIEVEESASGVRIHALYPPRKNRDEPGTRVKIDFDVSLPPGVRFIGKTEVGDIEALGLSDSVEAFSAVGDIRIETAAYAEARTTNGNISVSLGRADWNGTLKFETTNGDIKVELPGGADLEILATSTNGDFETDLFPVDDNRHGIPGARVRGKLGSGGRRLVLETVNGDLELTRRRR